MGGKESKQFPITTEEALKRGNINVQRIKLNES